MNKSIVIGIIIVIIVLIIGIVYSMFSSVPLENNLVDIEEEIVIDENILVEEELVLEEPSLEGRELSVELTESFSLATP